MALENLTENSIQKYRHTLHSLRNTHYRRIYETKGIPRLAGEDVVVEVQDIVHYSSRKGRVQTLTVEEGCAIVAHVSLRNAVYRTGDEDYIRVEPVLNCGSPRGLKGASIFAVVHALQVGVRKAPVASVLARLVVIDIGKR